MNPGFSLVSGLVRLGALLFALIIASSALAQISFQRDHGSTIKREYGNSVIQSSDDGFYVIGEDVHLDYSGHGVLMRTNALGDTLWWRELAVNDSAIVSMHYIRLCNDGSLIAVGGVHHGWNGSNLDVDLYVTKLDTSGQQIWSRSAGDSQVQAGLQVREAVGGTGYICAGAVGPGIGPEYDFYVVRLNAMGDTLWTRSYGIPDDPEQAYAIEAISDSTWVVVGKKQVSMTTTYIHVVAINDQGDTLWTRTMDDFGVCYAEDVETLPNDHIVISGFSLGGFGCARPLLLELDENGDMLWFQNYDHGTCEWAYDMCETNTGYALFGSASDEMLWLTNVDQQGDTIWSRSFAVGILGNSGYSVEQTSDGGFVMTGVAIFPGTGGADFQIILIKTDTLGNVISSTHDIVMDPSVSVSLFPNPTDAMTIFQYTTSGAGEFSLMLHDAGGRVVRSVFTNQHRAPGRYDVPIDLMGLASGSYTLVLSNGGRAVSVKAIKQ